MSLSKPMETMVAATAAGVGGFVSTSILFPLDTLKTRMQSKSKTSSSPKDTQEMKKQDKLTSFLSLYQGIQYKSAQSLTAKFLYFYIYTALSQVATPTNGKSLSTLTTLCIGYISECLHVPLTLPMEVITTRIQTQTRGEINQNLIQIIQQMYQESGLKGFYKGLQAHLVICLQPAIQYTVFEKLKTIYLKHSNGISKVLGAFEAFVLGALARSIATLLLFPYIRGKVLMQTKKKAISTTNEDGTPLQPVAEDGVLATLRTVVQEEGVSSLYRGLGPELAKGALSSALMLMIKEKIQENIRLMILLSSKA